MTPTRDLTGLLPEGYRLRLKWIGFRPITVAGTRRWLELVRVVERTSSERHGYDNQTRWQFVGFWDEVYPSLAKSAGIAEL